MSSVCPLNKHSCKCDVSAPKDSKFYPCMLAKRLGTLVRLLGSSFEDEALNSARALRRVLPDEGLTFGDLALLIENCDGRLEALRYSEVEAKAIFERGVERGKAQTNGSGNFSGQYLDGFGQPLWKEVAKFCHENPGFAGLKPNEQDVVEQAPYRLTRFGKLTRPTEGFLLSIFWKLGGSFK
jgi:hypothetical protein